MTVNEIEQEVMFQTDTDLHDLGDFQPFLLGYINEGYDLLVYAFVKKHTATHDDEYPKLAEGSDEPRLPEWAHRAIADYATYLVYRNGNGMKQSRGMAFLQSFEGVRRRLASENRATQFVHIPV